MDYYEMLEIAKNNDTIPKYCSECKKLASFNVQIAEDNKKNTLLFLHCSECHKVAEAISPLPSLNSEELLKLYELIIDEEHFYIKEHQSRVNFYITLITALIGGTFVGLTRASQSFHYIFLSLLPLLIAPVSWIGNKGSARTYKRFLEVVTYRAKMELILGLTKPLFISDDIAEDQRYWETESFVFQGHLDSRKKGSSPQFVAVNMEQGYAKSTKHLFLLTSIFGIVVAISLALAGLYSYLR